MKRIFYRIAWFLWKPLWFLIRPNRRIALVVIEHAGQILMVRNSFGSGNWTFPGGGIKRGEMPEEAVRREVKEEVGIVLGYIEPIGNFRSKEPFRARTISCFGATADDTSLKVDKGEIVEAEWISLSNLPELESADTRTILEMYKRIR